MHFKTLSWYSIGEALPFRSLLNTGDPNREGSGSHRGQEIYIPLIADPLDSARHACAAHGYCLETTTVILEQFYEERAALNERPVFG